jgi:hypothetical protein
MAARKTGVGITALMRRATGMRTTLWGPGIVGYGCSDKLVSKPRGYENGKLCRYARHLAGVDEAALERPIQELVNYLREHYGTG